MRRSPFFYVGDKYKLVGQLSNLFPMKIKTLYEPFCGGGSVFLNTKAVNYKVNDNNKWMIKLHTFLYSYRNKPEAFLALLERTIKQYKLSASYLGINVPASLKKQYIKTHYAVYNKKAYSKLKSDFNKDKSNMLLLYILLIYGFNHMIRFNNSGDFNLPVGNVDYNKNVVNALTDYFDFSRASNIKFKAIDFQNFINANKYETADFIYLDPPYLISSSEYNKNWTESEEKRLLKVLDKLNAKGVKFGLSNVLSHKGKKNVILQNWAKNYNIYYLKSNYISRFDNTVKKDTIEVFITNY